MTGAQDSFTSGPRLLEVLRGLGVRAEHLHRIEPHPKSHQDNVEMISREIAHRGLSVIVSDRPCIHLKGRAQLENVHQGKVLQGKAQSSAEEQGKTSGRGGTS